MDEVAYDAEMIAAFLEPRPGESVPAQYAHDLAHMAASEHERALWERSQVRNWEIWASRVVAREDRPMTGWKCDPALLEVRKCAGPRWALVFGRNGAMADYPTERECAAARERVVKALRLGESK